ncbi:uncharacterized protein LOC133850919 [Drosophila sulfurigaster albostrigata]|uniref:uncharacterized protein LOC133850919 n=1 Tax=Drosophila sulfurigaster albostrigata TaxID=89887 RepID=UPI002D218933|nr:uncharacterized protein LOC133850919 [Drosophila sulfurigaster albostrigata]
MRDETTKRRTQLLQLLTGVCHDVWERTYAKGSEEMCTVVRGDHRVGAGARETKRGARPQSYTPRQQQQRQRRQRRQQHPVSTASVSSCPNPPCLAAVWADAHVAISGDWEVAVRSWSIAENKQASE